MKISCEGKNRRMYTHTIFDGDVRYDKRFPSEKEAGFRYHSTNNEVSYRFYSNQISLYGEFSFEMKQSVDEILDMIPNLYADPYHRAAAHSHIAGLKTLLAAESGISRDN